MFLAGKQPTTSGGSAPFNEAGLYGFGEDSVMSGMMSSNADLDWQGSIFPDGIPRQGAVPEPFANYAHPPVAMDYHQDHDAYNSHPTIDSDPISSSISSPHSAQHTISPAGYQSPSSESQSVVDGATTDGSVDFAVDILHKPRGSNGEWLMIEPKQRVRVANKLGKMIRLIAKSSFELDWSTLGLQLVEKVDDTWVESDAKESFNIHSRKSQKLANPTTGAAMYICQLEVKIFVVYKTVSFIVEVNALDGGKLRYQTIEIATHNSGASDGKRKRDAVTPATNPPVASEGIISAPPVVQPVQVSQPPPQMPQMQQPMQVSQHQHQHHHQQPPPPAPDTSRYSMSEPMEMSNTPPAYSIPVNLEVQGAVRARGYFQYSDLRLKTDVEDIVDALDIVKNLSGKAYHWRQDSPIGAEPLRRPGDKEVQRVLPEVVQKTPEGLLAVNYVEIIPVLIEAFKQHLTDYQDIKDKVADMLDRQNRQTEQVLAELVSLKDEIHTVHQKLSIDRPSSVSEITSSDAEISQDTTPPNVVVITAKPVKPSKKRKQKRKPRNEHNSEKVARARPDSSDAFTDVAPDDGKSHAMVVIEHHEGRATDKVYTVDMSVIPKNTEQLQINVKKPAYTWKWKIMAAVTGGLLLAFIAIMLALYFGTTLFRPTPSPGGTTPSGAPLGWTPVNSVSNSNFETIVNGKATGWDGYYQVLDLGPKPAKRSFAELRNAPFDIGRYVMRLQHNSTAAENGFYQVGRQRIFLDPPPEGLKYFSANLTCWGNTRFASGEGFAELVLTAQYPDQQMSSFRSSWYPSSQTWAIRGFTMPLEQNPVMVMVEIENRITTGDMFVDACDLRFFISYGGAYTETDPEPYESP